MSMMKRTALCVVFLLAAVPSIAGEPGQGPARPQDPGARKAEQAGGAKASTPSVDRVLSQMDGAYRKLRTYRADFDQESEMKTFRRKRRSSGRVYFSKPGEMRWSYLEPEKREVYLSGDKIRIYLPGRNQVIEQTLNDAMPGMAPARLFMGVEELVGSFSVSLDCDSDEEAYCLRLVPKKAGAMSVEEVLLWVGKGNFLPLRTESSDVFGNRTTLFFRNAEVNVPLKPEIFHFEIPPGTEVINDAF